MQSDFTTFVSLVVLFLFTTKTSAAPSGPCDETDPVCLKKVIQAALPNFATGPQGMDIETLDPFYIDKLELNLTGGLKIQFKEGLSKGVRKCVVEYARVSQDRLESRFLCNLVIKGKYTSSGRLLIFPINGDGDASIKCKNLRINAVLKLKSKVGPEATYLEVVGISSNHSYDGRIQYNLTNLIKGSPETSKLVLAFMNQNWHLVAQELGDPIVEYGLNIILRNIKKLFSTVPVDQLFTTWRPCPKNSEKIKC